MKKEICLNEERWGMEILPLNGLTMVDLFCGAGIGATGFFLSGYEILFAVDNAKYAVDTYNRNIGNHAIQRDIRILKSEDIPYADVFTGGFPCFKAGTLITTNRGLVPIEEVTLSDYVLTHANSFNKVISLMKKNKKGIYRLKVQGSPETYVTEEHPYYVREMKWEYNKLIKKKERIFSKPIWKDAKNLSKNDFVGFSNNKNSSNIYNLTEEEAWLLGRYTADGYITNGKRANRENSYNHKITFCIGKKKINEFIEKVTSYNLGITEEKSIYKCRIINENFMKLALECGKGAENKIIPQFIIDLPVYLLEIFLNGYLSGDGHVEKGYIYCATSISQKLIFQIGQVVEKIYNTPYSIRKTEPNAIKIIEDRIVNEKTYWRISFRKTLMKQNKAVFLEDMLWCPVKSVDYIEEYEGFVYNIEVETENSYVANNCTVHNCQPFSFSGTGKGELDEKKGDLGYHFFRVIRDKQPKAFIMENVDGIISTKHRPFFLNLMKLFEDAGYDVFYEKDDKGNPKAVNCYEHGIPQLRKRVFVVGIRKDLQKKFIFPEPVKKEDRKNIRYAIGDLPEPNEKDNHSGYGIRKDESPFVNKVPPGGNWRDIPEEDQKKFLGKAFYSGGGRTGFLRKVLFENPAWTLTSCMNGKNNAQIVDNRDKYGTFAIENQDDYYKGDFSSRYKSRNRQKQWDEPSFTIVSSARQLPLYPEPPNFDIREMEKYSVPPPRRFTVRECLRLQTVPDWFNFSKDISVAHQYERCSGIPALMAYKLGIQLANLLRIGGNENTIF